MADETKQQRILSPRLLQFPRKQPAAGHTADHRDCPGCEDLRVTSTDSISRTDTFDQAFEVWIANRTLSPKSAASMGSRFSSRFVSPRYISERTEWDYRQYARALRKVFGAIPLGEIHLGHIRRYHQARAYNEGGLWAGECGANRIIKEIGMLTRILRSAGCWGEDKQREFEPLQREESDVQRALEPDEMHRLLETAASREDYSFVFHYTVAALQTCMSTNELRTLRLCDVELRHHVVKVRWEGAKNRFRVRTIPLETDDVRWSFQWLMERAYELGSRSPQHYLMPMRRPDHTFDPEVPMSDSGLKKRWEEVRTAAGLPWLRPYDLRHTAITRMAEAGVSIQVIMSFAGHVSLKMQQHYTTISVMAKAKAISSTWGPISRFPPQSSSAMPSPARVAGGS